MDARYVILGASVVLDKIDLASKVVCFVFSDSALSFSCSRAVFQACVIFVFCPMGVLRGVIACVFIFNKVKCSEYGSLEVASVTVFVVLSLRPEALAKAEREERAEEMEEGCWIVRVMSSA